MLMLEIASVAVVTAALVVAGQKWGPSLRRLWQLRAGAPQLLSDLASQTDLFDFIAMASLNDFSDEMVGHFARQLHGKLRGVVARHPGVVQRLKDPQTARESAAK